MVDVKRKIEFTINNNLTITNDSNTIIFIYLQHN